MTRCVGHRGAAGLAPENTLAAFQVGLDAGCDVLECDVHLTRDGKLAVIHDADLSRTTNGRGAVGDMTMDDVREFDASAHFSGGNFGRQTVPTLPEVLEFVAGRRPLQIEVKVTDRGPYPGIEDVVLATLARFKALETSQVISFDKGTLRRLRASAPALALGMLGPRRVWPDRYQQDAAALVDFARKGGANFLGLDRKFVKPEHVNAAQRAGLDVAVWTVNEVDEMRGCATMGLAGITSDRPDLLRRVLDDLGS